MLFPDDRPRLAGTVLRISVRLDPLLLERGELPAEAAALEAAGVDTLWLPEDADGLDGAVLLAGLHGSVRGPRLGLELGPQHPGWRHRVRTLQILTRGRLVLSSPADRVPENPPTPLLSVGTGSVVGLAGVIHPAGAENGDLAAAIAAGPGHEHWLSGDGSRGRVAWKNLREAATAAGATGIVVQHHPNLLDLLRNPDDEDERSDLQMATG